MANFWATDFWADGFWADGFWVEDAVEAGVFVDAYGPIASYPIMAPEDYLDAGVADPTGPTPLSLWFACRSRFGATTGYLCRLRARFGSDAD